ncbi:hypothetical protein D3C87_2139550 [compost metagenome]
MPHGLLHGLFKFVEKKRVVGLAERVHRIERGECLVFEMVDNAVAHRREKVALEVFNL